MVGGTQDDFARRGARPTPLVTADCLRAVPDGGHLRVAPDARITPLAREEAFRRGITLGPAPQAPRRLGVWSPDPTRLGDLASYVDHTLLRPDATVAEIDRLCDEALAHRFATVCVNGTWVRRCAEILAGSGVGVCAVGGFPLGASAPAVKVHEADHAIEDGACEVDMVQNVGALKSGDHAFVRGDVAGVAELCHRHGARLKVILETCLLTDEEKVLACRLAQEAGADFVKTSTGFAGGGATVADVELMRRTVGPDMGIKASGGVRDAATARAMLAAGATRIGASASVALVRGT